MKNTLKKLFSFLIVFGTPAIVIAIGLTGNEIGPALNALSAFSPVWIALSLLALLLYLAGDAAATWFFLRRQGTPISIGKAMFIAITGIYYANITPGASGGQPMQIHYLHKAGVPLGLGTSAMTVKYFCFQAMLALVSTLVWAFNAPYVAEQVGSSMWILVIGYVYNLVIILAITLMAFSRRLIRFLLKTALRIGIHLHLIKDPDATGKRWFEQQEAFHASIHLLCRQPSDVLVMVLFCAIQLFMQMLIIEFVYMGFHLEGNDLNQIITMGVLQYVSAAYTPLPGASGAQEGVFALYFSRIFPKDLLVVALLLWRFFTYYMSLLIGAIVTVTHGILEKTRSSSSHKGRDCKHES